MTRAERQDALTTPAGLQAARNACSGSRWTRAEQQIASGAGRVAGGGSSLTPIQQLGTCSAGPNT
jgi:hypothetical protein